MSDDRTVIVGRKTFEKKKKSSVAPPPHPAPYASFRLGELLKEESMCRQEITAFEKKIEMWKKNDQRPKTPSNVKVSHLHPLPLQILPYHFSLLSN